MKYIIYQTDRVGKNAKFFTYCFSQLEIRVRMGWTRYEAMKAIKTGEPTQAGPFWVVVKKVVQ